jgi:hypothetical protein
MAALGSLPASIFFPRNFSLAVFVIWGRRGEEEGAVIYVGAIGPGSFHKPGPLGHWSRLVARTGTDDLGWWALLSRHVPRIISPGSCHQPGPMTCFKDFTGKDFLFSILTVCFHFNRKKLSVDQ